MGRTDGRPQLTRRSLADSVDVAEAAERGLPALRRAQPEVHDAVRHDAARLRAPVLAVRGRVRRERERATFGLAGPGSRWHRSRKDSMSPLKQQRPAVRAEPGMREAIR